MKGFQFYEDSAKEWRWRLRDGNNKIVADSGEGYDEKKDCEKGAALFTTLGPNAPVNKVNANDTSGHGPEWEYYADKAAEWRWRFQAKNNKNLADGSEGYESEANVIRAIDNVKALLMEIGKENNGNYLPPTPGGSSGGGRFA